MVLGLVPRVKLEHEGMGDGSQHLHLLKHAGTLGFVHGLDGVVLDRLLAPPLVHDGVLPPAYRLVDVVAVHVEELPDAPRTPSPRLALDAPRVA